MEILIKGGVIVPVEGTPKKSDVLIENGIIARVEKSIEHRGAEVIKAEGSYVLPAFANTHTHIAMTLFRGFGEGLRLHEWLEKKIWPAEARLSREDVYWGALLGICELVRGGTTFFSDMYFFADAVARAAERAGISCAVSSGIIDMLPNSFRDACALVERYRGHDFVKTAIACHAPYTCSKETLIKAKELAKKEGLMFHMHVSETREELFTVLKQTGLRPIEYLNNIGILDKECVFAHMVYVSKREIVLAGRKGITVSHNPVSNLKLAGGGICPILEFYEAGANVTLGTDGPASNNSLSMLETLKYAALLQKHRYWDASLPSTRLMLRFATLNGWRTFGFNAGDIKEGMQAEIVIMRRHANLWPSHDHYANVVYSAKESNITAVIARGKVTYLNGNILFIDEEEVKAEVEERAKELVKAL